MRKRGSARGSSDTFETLWEEILREGRGFNVPGVRSQFRYYIDQRSRYLGSLFKTFGGRRLLNCGSGAGSWSVPYLQQGFQVVNLDLSQSALNVARLDHRIRGLEPVCVRGDMFRLPFEDGSFDVVTSYGVLEHFEDVESVIGEMGRVLAPGGLFHADIMPKAFSPSRFLSSYALEMLIAGAAHLAVAVFTANREEWNRARDSVSHRYYENDYPLRRYVDAVQAAGVADLKVRGARLFPFLPLSKQSYRSASVLERSYVRLLELCAPLLRRLDSFDAPLHHLALRLGAIWAVMGHRAGNVAGARKSFEWTE